MSSVVETHHQLTETATADAVRRLRTRAADIASEAGADEDTVEDVRLSVSEALANVVAHAYEGREGPVEMEVGAAGEELTVVVRDHGVGLEHPSSSEGAGYGLIIIERLTLRSSVFSTLGRGTELTMVFRLPPDGRVR